MLAGEGMDPEIIEYLLGITEKCNNRLFYDSRNKIRLPIQSSPLSEYLKDLNRFIFSGGLSFNVLGDSDGESDSQALIDLVVKQNRLQSSLYSLLEKAAVHGELLVEAKPKNLGYNLYFYSPRSYKVDDDGKVFIEHDVIKDKTTFVFRHEVDNQYYYDYPLVEKRMAKGFKWDKNVNKIAHGYNEVPVQIIKNKTSIDSDKGIQEFTWADINLACSIIKLEYGLDEGVYFFTNPQFTSNDPDNTINELVKKTGVLYSDEDSPIGLLQPKPLSEDVSNYLRDKKQAFRANLGVQDLSMNLTRSSSEISGKALTILKQPLIQKAEERWLSLVTDGLQPLFDLILRMAAKNQMITGQYKEVTINRIKPYFPDTPTDKLDKLRVVSELIEIGLSREEALKSEFWPHMSLEEIREKIRPNLEDVI